MNLITELSLNSYYSEELLDKLILDMKRQYYPQCQYIQEVLCGNKRYHGKMSDFYINPTLNFHYKLPSTTYTCVIEEGLVNYFTKKKFIQTVKPDTVLSLDTINTNPEYYEKRIWFFLDGFLMQKLGIIVKAHATILILYPNSETGVREDLIKQYIEEGREWSLLMMPYANYGHVRASSWSLFGTSNLLPYEKFTNFNNTVNVAKNSYSMFTNWTKLDPNLLTGNNTAIEIHDNAYHFPVPEETRSHIKVDPVMSTVYSFNNKNIQSFAYLPPEERWFRTERLDCPVHPNCILVYKWNDELKTKEYLQDAVLESYYPNIFKINTEWDGWIYVEWYYMHADGYKYVDIFKEYIEWMGEDEYFEAVKKGELPDAIKDFKWPDWYYSIKDFENNYPAKDPVRYRIDFINSIIGLFPDILEDYNDDVYDDAFDGVTDSFIVNLGKENAGNDLGGPNEGATDSTNKIYDREVMDNRGEIENPYSQEDFDEPHIWFAITNSTDTYRIFRIWVDGYRIIDFKHYEENNVDYVYIPKSLVTATSIIEVEMITEHSNPMTRVLYETLEDKFPVNTDVDYVRVADLALFLEENGNYVDQKYFVMENESGYKLDASHYAKLDNTKWGLKVTNDRLLNANINAFVSNKYLVTANTDTVDKAVLHIPDMTQKISDKRLEFYVDGRYIVTEANNILVTPPAGMGDRYSILTYLNDKENKHLTIFEYMPYDQKIVYKSDIIPETGIIDLLGYIKKPFSLEYYNVYLNGLKLNYTQIDTITENVIGIHDVKSTQNLIILEKCLDQEIIVPPDGYFSQNDKIYHNDDEYKEDINDKYTDENGTIEDTDIFDPLEDRNLIYEVEKEILNDIIAVNFIDPNKKQLVGEAYETARPRFVTGTRRYRVNPDVFVDLTGERKDLFHYNPDESTSFIIEPNPEESN